MFDCNQDLTIWNRWKNPDDKQSGEIFYRHIIPVKSKLKTRITRAASGGNTPSIKTATIISNSQMAIIPFHEDYRTPDVWIAMSQTDREKYFTVNEGDIIALGKIFVEITHGSPFREADLKARLRPDIFTVNAVQNNTRSRFGRHIKAEGV